MGGHDAALFLFDVEGGFLDVGCLEGAEIVGGFEAFVPGTAIHVGEDFEVGLGEEEVDRLGLVDPLLAAGGGIDDVFVADAEDGLVRGEGEIHLSREVRVLWSGGDDLAIFPGEEGEVPAFVISYEFLCHGFGCEFAALDRC